MKAVAPWRPLRELTTLHRDIDDLFSHFFGEEDWWPTTGRDRAMPSVESFVKEGQFVIRVDLPGIDPKGLDVAVEGNRLTVRGERTAKEQRDEKDYWYREVTYGRFERSIDLPPGVDSETIKASYHDGVVEITMTAPKELTPKKVPISVHH